MKMKKKPKCKKWHSKNVMPVEFENCIFLITNSNCSNSWHIIGFRNGDTIYSTKGDAVCEEALVERWCYIDLN